MKIFNHSGKLVGATILSIGTLSLLFSGCSGYNITPSETQQTSITIKPSLTQSSSPLISTTPSTDPVTKGSNLSIYLDKPQVAAGEVFTVNILIDTQTISRGAQALLTFDPSSVQCNGVSEGDFFQNWAKSNNLNTTMMPSAPVIDNIKGTVALTAVTILGQTSSDQLGQQGSGVKGKGVLFSYQMLAKNGVNKLTTFKLSKGAIIDVNGDLIPNVVQKEGQVTIGNP